MPLAATSRSISDAGAWAQLGVGGDKRPARMPGRDAGLSMGDGWMMRLMMVDG